MTESDISSLFAALKESMIKAGVISLEKQKNVVNIGKKPEILEYNDDFSLKQSAAKTEVDNEVQELLLSTVINTVNAKELHVDAEELTSSTELFSDSSVQFNLIIDPLDGTLEYVNGTDKFWINVGLFKNGEPVFILIYRPVKKEFYCLEEKNIFFENEDGKTKVEPPSNISETEITVNGRVSLEIKASLIMSGFSVTGDKKVLWPEAIEGCIKGKYKCCIFHTPQTRDILLGVLLSKLPGGFAVDWERRPIIWAAEKRVPKVIFGFGEVPTQVLTSLK